MLLDGINACSFLFLLKCELSNSNISLSKYFSQNKPIQTFKEQISFDKENLKKKAVIIINLYFITPLSFTQACNSIFPLPWLFKADVLGWLKYILRLNFEISIIPLITTRIKVSINQVSYNQHLILCPDFVLSLYSPVSLQQCISTWLIEGQRIYNVLIVSVFL